MEFYVAGPFEISRHGKKRNITKESVADLKAKMEAWEEGLSESCGCYVFARKTGGGTLPWYVGQACRRSMLGESLNSENRGKYNEVLDEKGTPLLFAIPALTPGGKFRKRPKAGGLDSLDFLERWLIAAALERNHNLINNKETRFLRQLHVVGIMNPTQGESTAASQELSSVLFG